MNFSSLLEVPLSVRMGVLCFGSTQDENKLRVVMFW